MPRITFNGQSFQIDTRRIWLTAAAVDYPRIPHELWPERLAAVRQAGFNAVETGCPWLVHEPRPGRFSFDGQANIKRFVELCGEAGLHVILTVGPYVGRGYDGGGLPVWLSEMPDIQLREGNDAYLARVTTYLRRLLGEVSDLQLTRRGPILLVQAEHAWTCGNEEQATAYLQEVNRIIGESGINVPIISANDLWVESPGAIETWRGSEDLLANLRQLRAVQPNAPRLVRVDSAGEPAWGRPPAGTVSAEDLQRRLCEVLAAGAQPIVAPFHAGTNFDLLGGRTITPDGPGFFTTAAAAGPPLGEAGARGEKYEAVKQIITFADSFGHVFADLDPDYQPILLDPDDPTTSGRGTRPHARLSAVPLRGPQGRAVFVFSDGKSRETTLLLDDGLRMPVHLDGRPVAWFVFNADLHGAGRLDYANVSPLMIVDRRIAVFFGVAKTPAFLSISGSPLETTVPSGATPTVVQHKDLTIVICNEEQSRRTYTDGQSVYVGVSGLGADGEPLPAPGVRKATLIQRDGEPQTITPGAAASPGARRRSTRGPSLTDWEVSPADDYVTGDSPRYASLDGPATLVSCGTSTGYGWYRIETRLNATKKRLVHFPYLAHRAVVYVDGEPVGVVGESPDAQPAPVSMRLSKGKCTIVALTDHLGRFSDGNDLGRQTGLFGHLYEIKALRIGRPKTIDAEPVDPFALRGFIAGLTRGQLSDTRQVVWSFTHQRKAPVVLDVNNAAVSGTFLLNDVPFAYYTGDTGTRRLTELLSSDTHEHFKRGRNEIRFAPDGGLGDRVDELIKATQFYEAVDVLTADARWSFAKWEQPQTRGFEPAPKAQRKTDAAVPRWWRCTFDVSEPRGPLWFDTTGLTKGQVFVNGVDLGRYFTTTHDGKTVGPQMRLYIPESRLRYDEPNELVLFDEAGADPGRTKLIFDSTGDLD